MDPVCKRGWTRFEAMLYWKGEWSRSPAKECDCGLTSLPATCNAHRHNAELLSGYSSCYMTCRTAAGNRDEFFRMNHLVTSPSFGDTWLVRHTDAWIPLGHNR